MAYKDVAAGWDKESEKGKWVSWTLDLKAIDSPEVRAQAKDGKVFMSYFKPREKKNPKAPDHKFQVKVPDAPEQPERATPKDDDLPFR